MMLMTVRFEIIPFAADDRGLWLVSGEDAWRPPLPLSADTTVQAEVDLELGRQALARQALADSLDLPARPGDGDVLLRELVPAELSRLCHSTSWRQYGPSVMLTWCAVMSCSGPVRGVWPQALPVGDRLAQAVGKPARHGPTEPPTVRRIDVLYHGLRHLRFLADTDHDARAAFDENWMRHLSDLSPVLAGLYQPDEEKNRAA